MLLISLFVFIAGFASADSFGTGENQFEIDFVNISGDAGDLGSWSAGGDYTFSGVNHGDYRMGKFEITNDQWSKFQAAYGTVTGSPSYAYDTPPHWTGTNVPTTGVSWYEGAQFINWLNTSTGHQAAYKFTGTQGSGDYTLSVWDVTETDGTNLYRHKDAHYFMPTEDEWIKAAYWNGTSLQTWASTGDAVPTQSGWNFYVNGGYATDPYGPWNVGSGSEELNGTFDMMGNVCEWMESPYVSENYLPGSDRGVRGGSYNNFNQLAHGLGSSHRMVFSARSEFNIVGFRVASVPEPATLSLLALGGLLLRKRK